MYICTIGCIRMYVYIYVHKLWNLAQNQGASSNMFTKKKHLQFFCSKVCITAMTEGKVLSLTTIDQKAKHDCH